MGESFVRLVGYDERLRLFFFDVLVINDIKLVIVFKIMKVVLGVDIFLGFLVEVVSFI